MVSQAATPAPGGNLAAWQQWQQWQRLPGIYDIDGPCSDGKFTVGANGQLFLLSADGAMEPFARGPAGYQVPQGPEAYLAVTQGRRDDADNCSFARDDTYILDLGKTGIRRIDAAGTVSRLADIPGVDALGGITFDTTGRFSQRLVVTGTKQGKAMVFTVDCNGKVRSVTDSAPVVEGGIAVAPEGFGAFAGQLVAPDELSGKIYAIDAGGTASVIATSKLPVGGDIGAESAGFVPRGFAAGGGFIYTTDRGTPDNPHPGTDSLLRLTGDDLKPFGVQGGDLLVATEGGDLVEAVHCAATCDIRTVAAGPPTAHGEGHLVAVATNPNAVAATPGAGAANAQAGIAPLTPVLLGAGVLALLAVLGGAVILVRRRR